MLNPILISVSTRGEAESIINLLILAMLYNLLKGNYKASAIYYGLSVHFKIYPIIYALPIELYINHKERKHLSLKSI